ncbi:hypothetical protein HHI36_015135 [Cryptolaemus montrouzieri]|uniref:BAG domain-containing protein n=1 Tax=Cryptolaemus montrouzieri TaxID=559131 RepID=A0ABD2N4Q1_9CUCU
MSFVPQTRQNEYKMSNHRYKSDGLAEEKFSQTQSRIKSEPATAALKSDVPYGTTNKAQCTQNVTSTVTQDIIDDSIKSSEVPPKTAKVITPTAKQNPQDLESSSHIVKEVGKTVNQIVTYEEEALNKIEKITEDIENMYNEMEKIEIFSHESEYKKYEEFFLQKNIELDNVDPKNNEHIRDFRKAAVKYVQDCMYNLDQKQRNSIQ